MSNIKKLMMTAAGGGGLNVEEVFSTYLYAGNNSTQTITNGIDLDGEGGLVWIKGREGSSADHLLFDTERGATNAIISSSTSGTFTNANTLTSFLGDGFSVGNYVYVNHDGSLGSSFPSTFASWTFRKAPKFFDVVTYTGNGTAGRTVSHNLGSVPGCIIIKSRDTSTNWPVWHRTQSNMGNLNLTNSWTSGSWQYFGDGTSGGYTAPTDSTVTLSSGNVINGNGTEYVMYLFAHNDGDGEFGPNGDQDIIKCGSYTGNGSTDGPEINLGWEPQWVMVKASSRTGDWEMHDNMRGMTQTSDALIRANLSSAESALTIPIVSPTATGFKIQTNDLFYNGSGETYIYIAIRRGPMAVPESATEVFEPVAYTGNGDTAGQDLDFSGMTYSDLSIIMPTNFADYCLAWTRLRSEVNAVRTNSALFEAAYDPVEFDHMNKVKAVYQANFTPNQNSRPYVSFHWKRAPSFFDVVLYTGNGTSGHVIDHNLGVVPEMMWVKNLTDFENWAVYYGDNTDYLKLNENAATVDDNTIWNDTSPTNSNFTVGSNFAVNESGSVIAAYLFATLSGVSKVGSYTGNGTSQTIDCGFSSGARFIMVKRKDSTGNWYVWNSDRGIVAGNDPYIQFDTAATENISTDLVDPHSSGFIVNGTTVNASGGEYIFYAIA